MQFMILATSIISYTRTKQRIRDTTWSTLNTLKSSTLQSISIFLILLQCAMTIMTKPDTSK